MRRFIVETPSAVFQIVVDNGTVVDANVIAQELIGLPQHDAISRLVEWDGAWEEIGGPVTDWPKGWRTE